LIIKTSKESKNKIAVIILHEIYGVNRFIEETCTEYYLQGFDVFCPNMIQRKNFLYSESAEAYQTFLDNVGFDFYVEELVLELKLTYEKVLIVGFSVGATIAWRCSQNSFCDAIICFYGSRIRDFTIIQPLCPVLLLFAEQDSFDVYRVIKQLAGKTNVNLYILHASHGFMDRYYNHFSWDQAELSKKYIRKFLTETKLFDT